MADELIAFGNNGGDRLEIELLYQDDSTAYVHLKIGSCCVYAIDHIVPVELITSLLAIALDYGNVAEAAPKWLEWSDEVNTRIIEGISHWREFDDWWYENERTPRFKQEAFKKWLESR